MLAPFASPVARHHATSQQSSLPVRLDKPRHQRIEASGLGLTLIGQHLVAHQLLARIHAGSSRISVDAIGRFRVAGAGNWQ